VSLVTVDKSPKPSWLMAQTAALVGAAVVAMAFKADDTMGAKLLLADELVLPWGKALVLRDEILLMPFIPISE
jgi:hypothetical protein